MLFLSSRPRWARVGLQALVVAFVCVTVVLAQPATAPTVEPSGALTLSEAIKAALAANPALAVSAYELKAADARIDQAKLRINPALSVDLENFAGTGETRGTRALERTLSLSQVVELGDKRGLRTDLALSDRELIGVTRQAEQLDVLTEVTRRYIDLVAAQDRVQLAASSREIVRRSLDAISARVQAARSPEAERSRARIALTRARIEEQQAQSELRTARLALGALWASSNPVFTTAQADLFAQEPVGSFEQLVLRLERNPDFVRFASETRVREAELRLARSQARPNLTFGAGIRRLNASHDTALMAGFSMDLPLFNRNQGAIHEAQVRLEQTDAERRAAFLRARATVYGLYQELLASRDRMQTLRTEALSQAQSALEQTQSGYDRGRFSYLELATAQQDVLDIRTAAIDAAADAHRALAEIERLTGEPLAAPATN